MDIPTKSSLEKLDIPRHIKIAIFEAGIKSIDQLCELRIDILWDLCDRKNSILIDIIKKIESII